MIFSQNNPNKAVKSLKSSQTTTIKKLVVGEKLYAEDTVADGFFDKISNLKTLGDITATSYDKFAIDYVHILEICKNGRKVRPISAIKAEELLHKIIPNVSDFYSITALHFLNGGNPAIKHFQFLVNKLLSNIELASIQEMNNVHAIILHKGHGKDKHLASSYRTISSCPFTAKAVDMYLGELSKDDWKTSQAETQFQGEGMSHELASLLLTVTIQHSISNNEPLFALLLDAESAFDLVLRKILIRRLYLDSEEPDQRIRFWDLRLDNSTTYCQWEQELLGPIKDQLGVEQGGINSSEFYKIYNNEQLSTAHHSGLGVTVMNEVVAAICQADDTVLVSNDVRQLQLLLQLSLAYCEKYQVRLSASKTKLLVFGKDDSDYVKYSKMVNPVNIDGKKTEFVFSMLPLQPSSFFPKDYFSQKLSWRHPLNGSLLSPPINLFCKSRADLCCSSSVFWSCHADPQPE